jgi:hypothetical protein
VIPDVLIIIVLKVELDALFLPDGAILTLKGLSSYFIIEDG